MDKCLTGYEILDYLDEEKLHITRAQSGDTEAFTPIVHRYKYQSV